MRAVPTELLTLTPDGWLATGDLAWVDDQARVRLVGREKELIPWAGGWLLDPQHLSNLVTRSIAVKDAMVVHAHPADPRLSVYVFPDWPRIRDDVRWRRDIAAGLSEDQALKPHLVEAIRYAASLLTIPAELDTDRVWILPRKLERTPTHKESEYIRWNGPGFTRREPSDPSIRDRLLWPSLRHPRLMVATWLMPVSLRRERARCPARRSPAGDRQLCRRLVSG